MTYTTNIPVTGDSLGGTRDRVRTNFQQIQTVFSVNHVAFNALGEGKHKYLQMPEVTASGAGIPTTAVDEGGLYTNPDSAVTPKTALFFRTESNGTSVQLTGVGGVTPTILTGTFSATSTSTYAAITPALPQNIYGFIIFLRLGGGSFASQMGTFFTDTQNAYGYGGRVKTNGSSMEYPIELENIPTTNDLILYGRTGDLGNMTVQWRLHYWAI